eukprot:3396552-Prymnesium_polylepis.1
MVTRIPSRDFVLGLGGVGADVLIELFGQNMVKETRGGKGPEGRLRNTDVSSDTVVTSDGDLATVDKILAQLVVAGTLKIEVAESETNITFFHSEADAVEFAGAGGSVQNEGVLQKEILDLKTQLQSSLDTMCKNQACASSQIDATNTEVQKLAIAMKDHEEQVKVANEKAAASVERLAGTMGDFMERFTTHSANTQRAQERGIAQGGYSGGRARAAAHGTHSAHIECSS